MKCVIVLEIFPDTRHLSSTNHVIQEELPISRRTVISYDGPAKALQMMQDIVDGKIPPESGLEDGI